MKMQAVGSDFCLFFVLFRLEGGVQRDRLHYLNFPCTTKGSFLFPCTPVGLRGKKGRVCMEDIRAQTTEMRSASLLITLSSLKFLKLYWKKIKFY